LDYKLVETEAQLDRFFDDVQGIEWLCFDTEFVGEKRYVTLICLIQVNCAKGNYLLDSLKLPHLEPLFKLLEDPSILKITHAGENDYRLLYKQYNVLPKNTFDTQLAAGLIGYRYPSGLSKLVSGELGVNLRKGYAVTDWSARPFSKRQLDYALDDVIILEPLWKSLKQKLEEAGRLDWALEACQQMEDAAYYYQDPDHEALTSNLIISQKKREQVFLIRLYAWRNAEAKRKDYSKNMVLPTKLIGQIVKAMRSGKQGLLDNRRIPDYITRKYADVFVGFYQKPITEAEEAILQRLPIATKDDTRDEILLELLYLLMKYRAIEEEVSHALVMPRNAIKRMKNDPDVLQSILGSGWRKELLGEDFVNWLKNYDKLELSIEGGQIAIRI